MYNETLIISKIKKGDAKAFELLFTKYHRLVFNFIYSFLKNVEATENHVQEVFVNVWEMRSELDETIQISRLLYKISKQKALNHIRKSLNERIYKDFVIQSYNDSDHSTEETIGFNELNGFIRGCIDELPERRKEIFLESMDAGLSYKEIAIKLNISENTVDSQIRNALNYIRGKVLDFLKNS